MKKEECMEKVRKLLALAESDNESEAMAALVKAKELMARYRIEQGEVDDSPHEEEAVSMSYTSVTFSKRRNPWTIDLAAVVGDNFRCKAGRKSERGRQTNTIFFIGLESDVAACEEIFRYAMRSVEESIDEIWDDADEKGLPLDEKKALCNGYGFGFAEGLMEAFDKQRDGSEEGKENDLAMSAPKKVFDFLRIRGFERDNDGFSDDARDWMDEKGWSKGYEDGKEFKPGERLKGAMERASA